VTDGGLGQAVLMRRRHSRPQRRGPASLDSGSRRRWSWWRSGGTSGTGSPIGT